MRIFIIYAILLMTACTRQAIPVKHELPIDFKRSATHCLRDWLIGEDAGGFWEQVGTSPQDVSAELVGDNPCIEWSGKACGQYELMYIVGDICCRDTAYVRPLKCCLTGSSQCN